MFKIILITKEPAHYQKIQQALNHAGFSVSIKSNDINVFAEVEKQQIDLLLIDIEGPQAMNKDSFLWELLSEIKGTRRRISTIILIPRNLLSLVDSRLEISDFISKPIDPVELETRIRRSLKLASYLGSDKVIKSGDLLIDQDTCEVFIAGKPVELTFKEFELLKFLALNKNRVFTREALLNEVWSIDYFGGDRTVDVHIRRLRSKIEDAEHTFIDTVRNIGYKFKPPNK